MTTTSGPPRRLPQPIGAPSQALVKPPARKLVNRVPPAPCPRILFYAVEGFGKTTFGAYAPDPVILMARDETGVDRLLQSASIPELPAERCETWTDLMQWLDTLIEDQQGRKTLVLDAAGGFERLCIEHVCTNSFNGSMKEFDAYGRGYKIFPSEWMKMLGRLDSLNARGMLVIVLAHATVKPFDDPESAKYDRYRIDLNDHIEAPMKRWADAILFGNFYTAVVKDNEKAAKGKGKGGRERHIYTNRCAAYDAKNGYRMPDDIILPNDPAQNWATVWEHIEASTTKENQQ